MIRIATRFPMRFMHQRRSAAAQGVLVNRLCGDAVESGAQAVPTGRKSRSHSVADSPTRLALNSPFHSSTWITMDEAPSALDSARTLTRYLRL